MLDGRSTQNTHPNRVSILGVPISVVTMESALEYVASNFEGLRGEYICAANAHTTVMAHEDKAYLTVQSESAVTLPDGKPLSVVGKHRSGETMEKVTGTHFLQAIFTDARFSGKKHFFYGTTQTDLEKMIPNIRRTYPDVAICGFEPSVFRDLSNSEVNELADRIKAANADFIWVALGAPRQELLMHRLKGKVNGVMTGVGGAFHILAGSINDAPAWMQNAGLEWFYRLWKEPKRLFKRYLVTNTKFIYYLLTTK